MLGFSHITFPLNQVTKGRVKAKLFWSESQQKAFVVLKYRLFFAPMLTLPYLNSNTNATNYRYNHKHRNVVEIKIHFINIKELKYAYIHKGNKLARVMVAYL